MPRRGSNDASRRAYTLLEMVLVLAILASLGALAWPRIRPLLQRSELKAAALQLQADLGDARDQAVRHREIWELRYRPGSSQYQLGPKRIASEWPQATPETPYDDIRSAEGKTSVHDANIDPIRELPNEIMFPGHVPAIAARFPVTVTAEKDDVSNRGSDLDPVEDWVSAAEFRPTGRATETTLVLTQVDTHRSIELRLRGLTGTVQIGLVEEVMRTKDPTFDAGAVLPASHRGTDLESQPKDAFK